MYQKYIAKLKVIFLTTSIYLPIRLKGNHENTYTPHLRLCNTMQVLGRHQDALENVRSSFKSWRYWRPCLNRIKLHQSHSSLGLTSELSVSYDVYFHGLQHHRNCIMGLKIILALFSVVLCFLQIVFGIYPQRQWTF